MSETTQGYLGIDMGAATFLNFELAVVANAFD